MNRRAKWIMAPIDTEQAGIAFVRAFDAKKTVKKATLSVSAIGLYAAYINQKRVGNAVLAPGWTIYNERVQYQTYDVTALLDTSNTLSIEVGAGWAVGNIAWGTKMFADQTALVASLTVLYTDGTREEIVTDTAWDVYTTPILYSDIYHGETVDKTAEIKHLGKAIRSNYKTKLIAQVGELITEHERVAPVELIRTPKGETVIDFGQEVTGYVEVRIKAARGARILLHHAEVLDKEGNFYTENLRHAKCEDLYICSGGEDVFKPSFSFQGFRYVRLSEFPTETVDLDAFCAIVVHSDMKRTGYFRCGNEKINQLYHNVIWGQKGNYLDTPTDCPQRDERLGWTGDAQIFARTAAINFNVKKFFTKWLGEMAIEQRPNGGIPEFIPRCKKNRGEYVAVATGWADAACIIPWELYLAYGDKKLLAEHYPMMRKWIMYLHYTGPEEFLWLGGDHYGDWLAMDHGEDSYKGATSTDFIASAFYANSVALLLKAEKALGYDTAKFEERYRKVVSAFREHYIPNGELHQYPDLNPNGISDPPNETQTAYALVLKFNLCEEKDRQRFADRLAEMIRENGMRMTTGFLGTPYLLHALTENGHTDVAYELLFQEQNPSWLYSVNHGATTIWEHWNGIKEDGSFWSKDMNSFNHYAYGAVYDWIFGKAVGIDPMDDAPAYREITLAPHPDRRLGFADGSIDTKFGTIRSHWYYKDDVVYYEFTIPQGVTAHLTLPSGKIETLGEGTYHFAE
ncbi:MAG: family 78 glycoside hydrolase catalytic domain, partial [Clostridia bacterium]|nr:family 78 glycoside hydrolase catalytic domain [Clostridia bacterium]